MVTLHRYRNKANESDALVETCASPNKQPESHEIAQNVTSRADPDNGRPRSDDHRSSDSALEHDRMVGPTLAEEESILRCLGAALIIQWNTLPRKLQRELFDNAGSMGELLDTAEFRGKVARFLHRHKDDEEAEK